MPLSPIIPPPSYNFFQSFPDILYLPVNGKEVDYVPRLVIALSGASTLAPCYDKYGIIWSWQTFETGIIPGTSSAGLTALSSTQSVFPSSWDTTTCFATSTPLTPDPSPYPKTWEKEGALSGELFNPFAVETACVATSITFTLSTQFWTDTKIAILSTNTNFGLFTVSLTGNGVSQNTFSEFEITLATLNVYVSGICSKVGTFELSGWEINITKELTSIPPPNLKFYTPNRLVLSSTPVVFENVSTTLDSVTSLTIDLDDGKTTFLTGNNIFNSLTASYDVLGFKTLKITASPPYGNTVITRNLSDIIQVLDTYDTVSPTEYRSLLAPIELPWNIQPQVYANDWVIEDNINSCFKKFYDNLNYLETRGRLYNNKVTDYFGYLGQIPFASDLLPNRCYFWTWADLDCLNTNLPYAVTWRDVFFSSSPAGRGAWTSTTLSGDCGRWVNHKPGVSDFNISCFEKYCTEWKWASRKEQNALIPITWSQTVSGAQYEKRWFYQPCTTNPDQIIDTSCNYGVWNVNIPGLDTYYDPIANCTRQFRCFYTGIASRNNQIYTSKKIQIQLLTDQYNFGVSYLPKRFNDIKNICLDSENKIFILDRILSRIDVYTYIQGAIGEDWELFNSWGGVGSLNSKTRFLDPNDIHIDQLDNVWVCDTGNGAIKHYSNSGTWINTIRDAAFRTDPPLSLCVDSEKNIHVLTNKEIRVYSYNGEFLFSYFYEENIKGAKRVNTSYNREVIYIIAPSQAVKYFRNGVFYGYIIQEKDCVNNINAIYQDEFRNVLIATDDKILKYPDVMTLERIKDTLPPSYWALEDLYIHKDEYIQNWVYTKSFQRLWDNIEIFRSTLYFSSADACKSYIGPIHSKEKMIIGQNEIVTSTVVNRVLGYLWENFNTLINYFDPNCTE